MSDDAVCFIKTSHHLIPVNRVANVQLHSQDFVTVWLIPEHIARDSGILVSGRDYIDLKDEEAQEFVKLLRDNFKVVENVQIKI